MTRPEPIAMNSTAFLAPNEIIRDVLIVEPDPDRQTELSRVLALPGRRIVGTSSADGAYSLVHAHRPDAIFVAPGLENVSSVKLCADLRHLCPRSLIVCIHEEGDPTPIRELAAYDLQLSYAEIGVLPIGTLEHLRLSRAEPPD